MTFEEFINKYNGQYVEAEDPNNINQCMDLTFKYLDEVLKIDRATIRHEWAYEAFTQPNALTYEYFELIPIEQGSNPQYGDIMVYGTRVADAGHIEIFIDGDRNNFRSFSQNWPAGSPAHIINHNNYGVIGWLHPKQGGSMPFKNREEVIQAYQQRLLKNPTEEEINYWIGKDTKDFLIAACERLLAPFKNRDEVIDAYDKRLKRVPTEEDIKYWIGKPTRKFLEKANEELLKKLDECKKEPRTDADNKLIEEFDIWKNSLQ
jgi:hypothetical protein